jgi:hypothetical protein
MGITLGPVGTRRGWTSKVSCLSLASLKEAGKGLRRHILWLVSVLGVMLALPLGGWAQSLVPFRAKLLDTPSGAPQSAAVITVCPNTASLKQLPCFPATSSIYSDAAGTMPLADPFRADQLGNVVFYATAGAEFVVSVTGVISPGYSFVVDMNATNATVILGANNAWLGNETHAGTEAFNGATTAGKLNGNCVVDGVTNTTLAAALTCAGSNGVVEIPMYSVPSFTNATVPVGVTLRFDGPSCLNNSGTLTINGPIVPTPTWQIFCGSGTVALGPLPSSSMNVLWWWTGGEIGQALVAAYTSASSSGGFAWVPVDPAGGCYTWTTMLPLTTVGKYITYQGTVPPGQNNSTITGTCLNWTSTASGRAVTIDWTPSTGGAHAPGAGFRDMTISNNLCMANFGCGSSANGIVFGGTNSGGEAAFFENLRVEGFLNPWLTANSGSLSWGMTCVSCVFVFNTNGPNFAAPAENITFLASTSELNGTNIVLASGAEVTWSGGSIDRPSVCGVSLAGTAILHTSAVHWETGGGSGGTTNHLICDNGTDPTKWFPNGDSFLQDDSSGSVDYSFQSSEMLGSIEIFSSGKTYSGFFNPHGYANLDVDNGSPAVLTGTLGLSGTMTSVVSPAVPGGTIRFSHLDSSSGGVQPTCVFTSGGGTSPTCIVDNGSSDSMGTIQLGVGTGSPGTSGSVTLTFGATFVSQHSLVRCQWQVSQNLGGQWNARATIFDKTTAVGSSLANWDNNAVALTASTSYELTYRCASQ